MSISSLLSVMGGRVRSAFLAEITCDDAEMRQNFLDGLPTYGRIIIDTMPRRRPLAPDDPKVTALRVAGALHPHPDAVRDILVTYDNCFVKSPDLRWAKFTLGNGLLTQTDLDRALKLADAHERTGRADKARERLQYLQGR